MKHEILVFPVLAICYGVISCMAADFYYNGCFAYNQSLENIEISVNEDPLLTPKRCLSKCTKESNPYFYVRSGHVCACLKGIDNSITQNESKECTSPCKGDNQQLCGGESSIDVYKVSLCTHLESPEYGYVNQTIDTAWFSCVDGYYLQGPKVVHCNKTVYEWDQSVLPVCLKGRGPCRSHGWFIGFFIVFVVLILLLLGYTLSLRSQLKSVKLVSNVLHDNCGKTEVSCRGTSVNYSLPVAKSPEYA